MTGSRLGATAAAAALAPRALAPRLFLARAYPRGDGERPTDDILTDLWRRAPEEERSKVAVFAAAVHAVDGDLERALGWTARFEDERLAARVAASLHVALGRMEEGTRAARRALAHDPRDLDALRVLARARAGEANLVASTPLERLAALGEAFVAAQTLAASTPEDENARALLQRVTESGRRALSNTIRRIDMLHRRGQGPMWLAALCVALGPLAQLPALEEGERIFDDFADGDPFDGAPYAWLRFSDVICGGDVCCYGTYEPAEGGRPREAGGRHLCGAQLPSRIRRHLIAPRSSCLVSEEAGFRVGLSTRGLRPPRSRRCSRRRATAPRGRRGEELEAVLPRQ